MILNQKSLGKAAVQRSSQILKKTALDQQSRVGETIDSVQQDLNSLWQIMQALPKDRPLKAVLSELLLVVNHVEEWKSVPTSGSVVKSETPKKYKVKYQMGKKDDERLGNLVHELTHVAVDIAYDRAFVNYKGDIGDKPRLTKEQWKDKGYPSEEEYLLGSYWNIADTTYFLHQKLESLIKLAGTDKSSGLNQGRINMIVEKLKYGQKTPQAEYDTVLNQIIVWMHIWKTDSKTQLYLQISEAVMEAYKRRTQKIDLTVP